VFANHTILHSSYMVRPLALNVALCVVAALPCRHPTIGQSRARIAHVGAI
jgi:hypothetical protein